ncbi:MAG: hypothetical protein ACW99F_00860 [Candidatus Hodarchaeales archaeon]|jgi:hypothetical protein
MLNDINLESFLLKAEADPKIMEIMKGILYWCQAAGEAGLSIQEVAAVGTAGFHISQDESLKGLMEYLIKMNSLGIKPVDN